MLNIKPLSNNIFLEALQVAEKTKSGILIPETAEKNKPTMGKVVAIGPGKFRESGELVPISLKVGDTVLFKQYGMDEIEIDGKKYLVGNVDDVLAIV